MLEHLDEVLWTSLAQPNWNTLDAVPVALRTLATCASDQEANAAYHRVLFALGNNHAGTYYPVALAALPFLGEILDRADEWARLSTLNILIDLVGSFEPEPGFETVTNRENLRSGLRVLIREGISNLTPCIHALATSDSRTEHERKLAEELLALVSEPSEDE